MNVPSKVRQQTKSDANVLSSASGRASLRLHFIIVGGNIGGLACAYTLALAGHHVRVVDRLHHGDPTSWSGVRIPPNLSKILAEWGLGEELKEKTIPCYRVVFNDLETGEVNGCIEWKEEVIKETGGDFLLMDHRDLYDMLYRLATDAGAEIIHGTEVVEVIPGSPDQESSFVGESVTYGPPCVVFANGETSYADIIVGIDGNNSLVRNIILSPEDDHGRYTGMNLFSTTYHIKQMESDPDLRRLIHSKIWDVWMGDKESVVGYPMGNRGEYALHAYWPDRHVRKDGEPEDAPSWTTQYPTQMMAEVLQMDKCNPILQKLIHLPSRIARTRYIELPSVEQWVHSSGTIVIMGDAAHPSLPCSNQSTGVVIEDAAVFGGLFARLRSWDQVPSLMEAFQDLRKGRSEVMAMQDLMVAHMAWLEPGPDRDARNEGMKQNMNRSMDDWDDAQMKEQWDGLSEVFCYNAMDEAADWWAGWGMLGEMAKQRARDQMDIPVGHAGTSLLNFVQTTSVTTHDDRWESH